MTTRYPYLVSASGSTFRCLDPGKLYSDRTAAPQDFFGRANSISCPTGLSPGSAFFVVTRTANDTLGMNEAYSIKWLHENGTTVWQKYCIARIWMIGVDGDSRSAALVHMLDKRQLMLGAAQKSYNTRRHSGGTYSTSSSDVSQYYTDSLNAGALWTWQEVLADLWDELPSAIRGTAPTLAYIPQVKPQNLSYFGDAWEAVGDLLARCQSMLVYDPIGDAFTVVRIGDPQNGLAAQVAALATRVMYDATPRQNLQLASIPETIRFYFPKYGIPSQTAAGGQTVRPYYTIDKPSNLAGCQAGTVKPYRTSFHAVYNSQADADKANYPPANDTELQNLASELAEKIADKIDLGAERGRIIWNGIVPTTALALGSEVASIQWRDLGTDEGCVTESRTAESLPEGQGPPVSIPPAKPPLCVEYYLNRGIEGWSGSVGNPTLLTGYISGWVGSQARAGNEADVGIAYQSAEAAPSTNGNYLISTTGAYRIVLSGYAKFGVTGTRTWGTTTRNTSSAGTPNHYHTYDENNYEKVAQGPGLSIDLYRKPLAGANALYSDNLGAYRRWKHNYAQPYDAEGWFAISAEWNVNLNAGDRISLKFTLGGYVDNSIFTLVDGYSPMMRVERLSTDQPTWVLF